MLAAFQPQGTTLIPRSTAASATTVQVTTGAIQGMRVSNLSTSVMAYVSLSASSGVSASYATTAQP